MTGTPSIEGLLRELAPQALGAVLRREPDDFGAAEDAVQEALLAASVRWPAEGVPDNPRGWLITVAVRRLVDWQRRESARRPKEAAAVQWLAGCAPGPDAARDDSLALLFLCCHPVLPRSGQVALTLRAVGGLTTAEIARAYLVPEATMTRRITRAKRRIADTGLRFALPGPGELPDRLAAVLEVLYLIFNEGYTASSGPLLRRADLTGEAIRLARQLRAQLPDEGEVAGLLALMLLTDARRAARVDATGALVPLADQDRSQWDAGQIAEGVTLIESALRAHPVGPYQLQAAIAAVHNEAADGRKSGECVIAVITADRHDRGMRATLICLFDGVQSLDVTGPLEVFAGANRYHGSDVYTIRTASIGGRPMRTSSNLVITPDVDLRTARAPHTLVVPGGEGTRSPDPEFVDWVRHTGSRAGRIVSVCTGAFVLAEAGLLDGRRATTHWSACDALARRYPAVEVDPEPIFVRDGAVATSAGVTAGIDLALALVEDDLGREAALTIARHLVMFLRRPGNQTQFSEQLSAQLAYREPIRDVQQWVAENPGRDLSVEALARRANLSPRQFARTFRADVGVTPGRYVSRVRLETARRLLEDTEDGVEEVARRCGYGTPESMRRAFLRAVGVGPAEYRRRF